MATVTPERVATGSGRTDRGGRDTITQGTSRGDRGGVLGGDKNTSTNYRKDLGFVTDDQQYAGILKSNAEFDSAISSSQGTVDAAQGELDTKRDEAVSALGGGNSIAATEFRDLFKKPAGLTSSMTSLERIGTDVAQWNEKVFGGGATSVTTGSTAPTAADNAIAAADKEREARAAAGGSVSLTAPEYNAINAYKRAAQNVIPVNVYSGETGALETTINMNRELLHTLAVKSFHGMDNTFQGFYKDKDGKVTTDPLKATGYHISGHIPEAGINMNKELYEGLQYANDTWRRGYLIKALESSTEAYNTSVSSIESGYATEMEGINEAQGLITAATDDRRAEFDQYKSRHQRRLQGLSNLMGA